MKYLMTIVLVLSALTVMQVFSDLNTVKPNIVKILNSSSIK